MPSLINLDQLNAVAQKIQDITWYLGRDAQRDHEPEPNCAVDVDCMREYHDRDVHYWSHLVVSLQVVAWTVVVNQTTSGTVFLRASDHVRHAFHYLSGDWEQRLDELHQAALHEKAKKEVLASRT